MKAEKVDTNTVSLLIPHRENNTNTYEGERLTFGVGHNRLLFSKYPFYNTLNSPFEKVSKYPLKKAPTFLGSWKSTVCSSSNFMSSLYFFDNKQHTNIENRGLDMAYIMRVEIRLA